MGHKETKDYIKSELNKGNSVPLERVRHSLSAQLTRAKVLGNEREVERKEEALRVVIWNLF